MDLVDRVRRTLSEFSLGHDLLRPLWRSATEQIAIGMFAARRDDSMKLAIDDRWRIQILRVTDAIGENDAATVAIRTQILSRFSDVVGNFGLWNREPSDRPGRAPA